MQKEILYHRKSARVMHQASSRAATATNYVGRVSSISHPRQQAAALDRRSRDGSSYA